MTNCHKGSSLATKCISDNRFVSSHCSQIHIYGHVRGRSAALSGIFPGYGKAKKGGRHWQIAVQPVVATGTQTVCDSDFLLHEKGVHPWWYNHGRDRDATL